MTIAFTIVTRNYLFQARTLMQSVASNWPDAKRCVILIDSPENYFLPEQEGYEIILSDSLNVPGFRHLAFSLDGISLCCLLKSAAALYLFQKYPAEVVVYLDGDTLLYRRPNELIEATKSTSVVFTPHVLAPIPLDSTRADFDLMRSGIFNAGLFAIRRDSASKQFLEWWYSNLLQSGSMRAEWSYDQAWLALAPTYFKQFGVLRNPGYNVAYWNLHERPLQGNLQDGITVATYYPLSLFHFSFFNPAAPETLANRGFIRVQATSEPLKSLALAYAGKLKGNGYEECKTWGYQYDHFTDGSEITDQHRAYYTIRVASERDSDADPFDPSFKTRSYRGWKSLYNVNHPVPRTLRRLRRTLNTLVGAIPLEF